MLIIPCAEHSRAEHSVLNIPVPLCLGPKLRPELWTRASVWVRAGVGGAQVPAQVLRSGASAVAPQLVANTQVQRIFRNKFSI